MRKFAGYADRYLWHHTPPVRRRCRSIRPIPSVNSATFSSDADPIAIVYDAEIASKVEPLVAAIRIPHAVPIGGETGRSLISGGTKPIGKCRSPGPRLMILQPCNIPAARPGRPKGVNISHRRWRVNVSQREAALPTRPGDESILCMMPLFHVFAVAMGLHLAAYCGGRLVIMPRYRPEAVLELIAAEKITILPAGPTVFVGLLDHEKFAGNRFFLGAYRLFGLGAAAGGDVARWPARGRRRAIHEGYGQTEAGPVLT